MTRSADRSPDGPVNILLVDDSPVNLVALEAMLADLGQNLVRASSGWQALELLAQDDYAVVLLDVQMEGLDGFETARRLRSRERSRPTPIIFLTGFSDKSTAATAYTLGAVDYLVKPIVPVILHAKVNFFVELFRKTRQIEHQAEQLRLAELEKAEKCALEEADRRKDEFLAMLAHELRNPLAPLVAGIHVLRQTDPGSRVREETLERMERQLRHLNRLVDDLLDVSRLVRGKVQLRRERLDLARLVRTTVRDGQTQPAGSLELAVRTPDTPVWVQGDAVRLVQVISNLLDNAAKFSDRKGRVEVRLVVSADGKQAVLTIRDEGIGIEADQLPRLFESFAQADRSLDRTRGGLGLGLAVVKGLVELHGGEVEAASAGAGQGAEFTVRLPVEEEPPLLRELPVSPRRPTNRLRILVIEDNQDAAQSLQLLLDLLGHETRVAYTGPDGVDMARRWQPDVVLCDIGLPGLDGYGVAKALRLHPKTAQVRLLAITGYGSEEDRSRSRQAGFDLHLTKPVDPADLVPLLAPP
jgi:signal transduction histidine kinase